MHKSETKTNYLKKKYPALRLRYASEMRSLTVELGNDGSIQLRQASRMHTLTQGLPY